MIKDIHFKSVEISNEFWQETYESTIKHALLSMYKPEIIKEWYITDLVIRDGKDPLIKWEKRMFPLTDEQLKEKFGVEVKK